VRIFKTKAYARAGLVGNPSDGYHGKTISLIVKNFSAEVVIYEWPELEVIPTRQDHCRFDNLQDFLRDQRLNGYYGGMRLIKASIKRFAEYCERKGIGLPAENFSLRYSSNIPRQVGLAGSSAIVTATVRALCGFYDVTIPKEILPGLILSVEKDELGISAGLQDRVAQVYEGLTYMDFDKEFMGEHGHGRYEPLDPGLLPPLYIAYQTELAESSEVFHNDIRKRYDAGERKVIDAMTTIAGLASQARPCLLERDYETLAQLMNRNFDERRSIYNLNPKHIRMVELARGIGASAQFAGSGGSVVGAYRDEAMFKQLKRAFEAESCAVIKPMIE
jgi:glucuronokinase